MGTVVKYAGAGGEGFAIDDAALPARAEALAKLSEPAAGVQTPVKRVLGAAVRQAFSNDPFEDYPRVVYGWKLFEGEEKDKERTGALYNQAVEGFLRRTFHSLTFVPQISFDETNISESVERKALNTALVPYRAAKMERQASLLKNAYDGLRALRIVLGPIWQKNLVDTVVPSRFLPELLVSAPVWFIETKKREESEGDSERDTIRFFCDLCETDQFAYLCQMYNCKVRLFTEFSGRDIMPLPLVNLVREVRNLFDYLVIATPYHNIAAKEWEEMPWTPATRKVDPFLFGFLREVPEWMFFLGRWSGTGLFPRIGEMIADTIEHLEKGKALLSTLSDRLVWYKTGYRVDLENVVVGPHLRPVESYQMPKTSIPRSRREEEKWRRQNHSLVKFADNVRREFEIGSLFSWLRGEREEAVTPKA